MYKKLFIVCVLVIAPEMFADGDDDESIITPDLVAAVFGFRHITEISQDEQFEFLFGDQPDDRVASMKSYPAQEMVPLK